MVSIASLWLPILLSAVFIFFASFLVHMVLPFHRGDFRGVPKEDEVMAALRGFGIPPGDYMVPRAGGPQGMKDPKFIEKHRLGPVIVMTVFPPGPLTMGPQLAQWFGFCLLVGLFSACIAAPALPPGSSYLHVFHLVDSVAFAGYALALLQNSIWYRRSWGSTLRHAADGLLYGLLTAGTFGWLWPR